MKFFYKNHLFNNIQNLKTFRPLFNSVDQEFAIRPMKDDAGCVTYGATAQVKDSAGWPTETFADDMNILGLYYTCYSTSTF